MKKRMILSSLLVSLTLCSCGVQQYESELDRILACPPSPYAAHVFSHQGSGIEECSETFAAYDLAISYGSRYLEQDLQMSSDGVLYCCHDATPKGLTGVEKPFSEMSSQEIDELRTTLDKQCIPRLSAVFERYGKAVTYVVELRQNENMLDAFVQLTQKYGLEDQVIVQSFDLNQLQQMEELFPDMPKLFLCSDSSLFEEALHLSYVDIIGVSGGLFTQDNCDRAHAAGKQFNVFVVNYTSSIRTAIEMGADSYFTDFTGKALMLEELYRKN